MPSSLFVFIVAKVYQRTNGPVNAHLVVWQDLCRTSYNIVSYLIYKFWVLWFQRRRFFHVSPIISISYGRYSRSGAWPIWTPGAWLAGFTKVTARHCYTQNIKGYTYIWFQRSFFYVFPIVSIWELMTSRVGPFFDPRGMIGRIYVGYH